MEKRQCPSLNRAYHFLPIHYKTFESQQTSQPFYHSSKLLVDDILTLLIFIKSPMTSSPLQVCLCPLLQRSEAMKAPRGMVSCTMIFAWSVPSHWFYLSRLDMFTFPNPLVYSGASRTCHESSLQWWREIEDIGTVK